MSYYLIIGRVDNLQLCNQNSNPIQLSKDLAELLTNKNASVEENIGYSDLDHIRDHFYFTILRKNMEYWDIHDIKGYEPYYLKSRQNWYHTVDP